MNNKSLLLIVIISIVIGVLLIALYVNLTIKTRKAMKESNDEALLDLQHEKREEKEEDMQLKNNKVQEEMKRSLEGKKDIALKDFEEEFLEEEPQEEFEVEVEIEEGDEEKEKSEQDVLKRTVLGVETFIDGELIVDGDLEILGRIKGNVSCSGDIEVQGKVEGDIHARSLYVWASDVNGNIFCEDVFQNAEETIVHGNIEAKYAEVEGIIEGDLIIKDVLILGKNAMIKGNIETREIEISRGATLFGKIIINKDE